MFERATRTQSRLRLALCGPAGSGKTYTALTVAKALGDRIAFLDTERGSASKYADRFGFDVVELDTFDPRHYVDVIEEADAQGYQVLIIDSLSHAWSGKGGALELVDNVQARSKSRNSFTAWREVTPLHNQLVDAILGCNCHVIVTMRSKTEYVLEDNGKGGKVPRKIGMAPVQRDGMDYEFDVVGDIDQGHTLVITKSRIPELADVVIREPGEKFARTVAAWVGVFPGEDVPEEPEDESGVDPSRWRATAGAEEPEEPLDAEALRAIVLERMAAKDWTKDQAVALIGAFGCTDADDLDANQRQAIAAILTSKSGTEWAAEVSI